jgi:hypothetical protein
MSRWFLWSTTTDEVAKAVFSPTKEVFVDADARRPGVQTLATFKLQVPVQRRVQPTTRALEVLPHPLQIDVPLAGAHD